MECTIFFDFPQMAVTVEVHVIKFPLTDICWTFDRFRFDVQFWSILYMNATFLYFPWWYCSIATSLNYLNKYQGDTIEQATYSLDMTMPIRDAWNLLKYWRIYAASDESFLFNHKFSYTPWSWIYCTLKLWRGSENNYFFKSLEFRRKIFNVFYKNFSSLQLVISSDIRLTFDYAYFYAHNQANIKKRHNTNIHFF